MIIKKSTLRKMIIFTLFILIIATASICCIGSVSGNTPERIFFLSKTFSLKIPPYIVSNNADYALSDEITAHYTLTGVEEYTCINGFIQVRNQMITLQEYIKQSEENFSAALYDYEKKPTLRNGSVGFNINFKIKGKEYDTYVMQSIIQRGNDIFILSLSTPLKNYNQKKLKEAFDALDNSITVTGDSLPSGKLFEYYIQNI